MHSPFDERASTWDDDPAKVERARVVAKAILAGVPVAPTARVLDYGAGTGLLSQQLAAHVASVTLADPSEGMRGVAESKVATGALPPGTRVWDLDLSKDAVPEERFDLIATVLTLHHIPDLEPVLAGFAALLHGGGHLCIADLEAEDGSFHEDQGAFGGHDGFDRDELTKMLMAAGFSDVQFTHCAEVEKHGRMYPLFLATCSAEPVR